MGTEEKRERLRRLREPCILGRSWRSQSQIENGFNVYRDPGHAVRFDGADDYASVSGLIDPDRVIGPVLDTMVTMAVALLLYEGGQADRYDQDAVEFGFAGVMRTLRSMRMVEGRLPAAGKSRLVRRTQWVRARRGGLVEISPKLGDMVEAGEVVAGISDAFGLRPTRVKSPVSGWVIARTLNPLVNPGDPLLHVAAEHGPDVDEPAERR